MPPVAVVPRPVIFEEEYQEEVIQHMHEIEQVTLASLDLMNAQPELRWFMRPYLVDFIVEIHQTFRLRPETLYLTLNIADRYVSKRIVFKRHYQLVGSAALLIAAKYEDAKDRVPSVSDLSSMCCQAYDESAFIQMEGHILQTLQWQLGHPTPEAWLRTYCMQTPEEVKTQNVARFLMENTLFHKEFIGIPSSLVASGALMLSRFICGQERRQFTTNVEQAASVAQLIDVHVGHNLQDLSMILMKKYSYQHFSNASGVVKDFYLSVSMARKSDDGSSVSASLLPAHSMSVSMTASGSSDSMDEGDYSMESSGSSTPSSMQSTPSRSKATDDEEEEEEDDDMPVTPLSFTNVHDPLASASQHGFHSSPSDRVAANTNKNKENQHHQSSGDRSSRDARSSMMMSRSTSSDLYQKAVPRIQIQPCQTGATASSTRTALGTNTNWQSTA